MKLPTYYIGIDISSTTFTVAVSSKPGECLESPTEYQNNLDGFAALLKSFESLQITTENTICCMETTGVYGEALTYYLYEHGYSVAVETALHVKRAFYPTGHKNDRIDSQQIAEYAQRFFDRLTLWQPQGVILEQIRVLLATRERLVRQRTNHKNALHALRRKVVPVPLAEHVHLDSIAQLTEHMKQLECQIKTLIDCDPQLGQQADLLRTIPGVGLLLAANMLVVLSNRPDKNLNHKTLAAYLGIAPYQHQSGSSVSKPAASRHFGPARIRKLLHLAARSIRTHNPDFRTYYDRKHAEGKHAYVIMNNIANKLLKIMCAILRDGIPFDPNYQSVHPQHLTRS
jgi:transposase